MATRDEIGGRSARDWQRRDEAQGGGEAESRGEPSGSPGSPGGESLQSQAARGGFSAGGGFGAQESTGYGTHGFAGQTTGETVRPSPVHDGTRVQYQYSSQESASQPGAYRRPESAQQGEFGGYGPRGGGYGSLASYASHGGYGVEGHDSQHGGGGTQAPARRGPKGYQRSDERIREDICDYLFQSVQTDSSEVTVAVKDGLVTLEGTVPERWMKHEIEDVAVACRGVKDVENKVRVAASGTGVAPGG